MSEYSANYIAKLAKEDKIDSLGRGGRLLVSQSDIENIDEATELEKGDIPGRSVRDMSGPSTPVAADMRNSLHKVFAIVLAVGFSVGAYAFSTSTAPQAVASSTRDMLRGVENVSAIVVREAKQKVAQEGVDDLIIDSLLETTVLAVDSFKNGIRITETMTATLININEEKPE